MNPVASLAQRFQSIENLVPPRWRLPLRYHGQRLVGGLEPEMVLLEELVRPGDVTLDIGANHGVYAFALAKIACEVHCFEPLPECCRFINAWASPKVTVHNIALSDGRGMLRLYLPILNGRCVHTRASLNRPDGPCEIREVEVMTLDSFSLSRVDFIKVDVEGLEASVLRGAEHTLKAHRPTLLIEIDRARHDRDSFLAVHSALRTLGYQAHVCKAGKLVECYEPWDASQEHINFIFPRYNRRD
jgi:FkbM family methyltransferase